MTKYFTERMRKMDNKFLLSLLNSVSVSGYEEILQQKVEAEMRPWADEIRKDEMNNLICVLNPEMGSRIMLSAHADEMGLMVSNITEEGRLQVIDRGGIVPHTYPGQQICIQTAKGTVYGVVEAYRQLFCKKDLGTRDFLIDIGAKDKKEAEAIVSLGDPIVPDTHIREMSNGRFTARALDDRIGVYIIMEALKYAKRLGCKAGVYAASTVGEETTKTGAYWCSTRIRPDFAVVVDVTYTGDCLGMDPSETGAVLLGKGPVLCNSPIVSKRLNEQMQKCGEKNGIPLQREAASRLSYTDADKIHFSNNGVPVVLVSVPLRYMHMPSEVADEQDVQNCIELIGRFLAEYQTEK